jgi:flavin-dependent dehydrogenase
MMESFDIVVVGSGVAGAPAAMLLARAGHKVLLVDRQVFPRDTLSTHFIWPRGVSYLNRWGLAEPIFKETPHFTTLEMNVEGISLKGSVPLSHLEARFRQLHGDSRGVTAMYCGPRRHFLDTFLQDEARKAGADVRDGTSFAGPMVEGGTVKGIHAVDATGKPFSVNARLVIGADGMHSTFAKKIGAHTTHSWELSTFAYWGYFSGIQRDELAFYRRGRLGMAIFPTSGGTHMVLAYGPTGWWNDFRKDAENNLYKTVAFCSPEIGAQVRDGKSEEPFKACGHMPAFHRELWGPGWVLIGDAGSFKDQATAIGITHAFRDAELVSNFIHKAFIGQMTMEAALTEYASVRAADYMDYFNLVCQVAEMNVYQRPEIEFFYGIHRDQVRVDNIISQFGDTLPLSPPAPATLDNGAADVIRAFEARAEGYLVNPFETGRWHGAAAGRS